MSAGCPSWCEQKPGHDQGHVMTRQAGPDAWAGLVDHRESGGRLAVSVSHHRRGEGTVCAVVGVAEAGPLGELLGRLGHADLAAAVAEVAATGREAAR